VFCKNALTVSKLLSALVGVTAQSKSVIVLPAGKALQHATGVANVTPIGPVLEPVPGFSQLALDDLKSA
jgi:hypothetical protein